MPPKASLDIPFPERVVPAAPVVPALYSSKGSIFGSKRGGHISEAQRRARLRARTVFGERWSEQVARVSQHSVNMRSTSSQHSINIQSTFRARSRWSEQVARVSANMPTN
jgi:hypothetical protein